MMSRQKEIQMKGNINKLAVFLIIAVIAMFTVVAMASADDRDHRGWKAIAGQYAMSGVGTCLTSAHGFTKYVPDSGYPYWHASSMATGIWTFRRDGTGTVEGTAFGINLPGAPSVSAASQKFTFNFTYELTDDNTITAEMVGLYQGIYVTGPPPIINCTVTTNTFHFFGYISADHKTITLPSGNEVQEYISPCFHVFNLCNLTRVLIRLDE